MPTVQSIAPLKPETRLDFRRRPHRDSRHRPLSQAVELQNAIYQLAQGAMDNPQELCKLVPLWTGLEDRRQVLAGHGKPKPVQARNEPGQRKRAKSKAGMIDPSEVAQSLAQASTVPVPTQARIDHQRPDAQDLQSCECGDGI